MRLGTKAANGLGMSRSHHTPLRLLSSKTGLFRLLTCFLQAPDLNKPVPSTYLVKTQALDDHDLRWNPRTLSEGEGLTSGDRYTNSFSLFLKMPQ